MKIEDLKNIGDRCPFCNGVNETKNGLMCDGCLTIIAFYHQEITVFRIPIDGNRFIFINNHAYNNHFYFYIYDVSSRTEYFKHYLEDLNSIDDLVNMRNRILDNLILE